MNRLILLCVLSLMAAAALGAQDATPENPYQGVSTPPPDETIVISSTPLPKPSAGRPASVQAPAQAPVQAPVQSQSKPTPVVNAPDPDAGMVAVEPSVSAPSQPSLVQRANLVDPDGDIVHPRPLRPGELPEGATIRVALLDRLSTTVSERGEAFRSRVTEDVMQGAQLLIPAGTEIDGQVVDVSSGHPGGRGSMRLRPQTMTFADGSRYQLRADLAGTQGSKTRVGSEGEVLPASRLKRDGIEYGGAVGAGVAAGAMIAGPVGGLTGGLIGVGVVTAHLLISHPQATLESGAILVFTLSEPLQITPAAIGGN